MVALHENTTTIICGCDMLAPSRIFTLRLDWAPATVVPQREDGLGRVSVERSGLTAEIAILNRTAVALAADSVVTISGRTGRKTYDSAEKIFEITDRQPIGLMIYNNSHHLNSPLEVVVRGFRKAPSTTFSKLCQVWPAFSDFLINYNHTDEDEFDHLRLLVAAEVNRLSTVYFNSVVEPLVQRRRRRTGMPTARVRGAMQARKAEAEAVRLPGFLDDKTEADFVERYGAVIDEVADVALRSADLGSTFKTDLHSLVFTIIRSSLKTEAFTGFVFAGFGTSEMFPTLQAVECDGIYFGQFRVVSNMLVDIDRRGPTAAIIPFAQTDMAERFIQGIDKTVEVGLEKIMTSMVTDILETGSPALPAAARDALRDAAQQRFSEGVQRLKASSEADLVGVVDHLSKKELSDMAYSLVEFTSRKRRYSIDPNTVGGPIDVAVLTLNEGFVWVRRKHYFDVALNPRYEQRLA